MLALESAIKSMSETKLFALITMLRTMIVTMFIMIVLGLVATYNNELTFQMPNLAFQMQSRNTLYFNKNAIRMQGMYLHMFFLDVFKRDQVGVLAEIVH